MKSFICTAYRDGSGWRRRWELCVVRWSLLVCPAPQRRFLQKGNNNTNINEKLTQLSISTSNIKMFVSYLCILLVPAHHQFKIKMKQISQTFSCCKFDSKTGKCQIGTLLDVLRSAVIVSHSNPSNVNYVFQNSNAYQHCVTPHLILWFNLNITLL